SIAGGAALVSNVEVSGTGSRPRRRGTRIECRCGPVGRVSRRERTLSGERATARREQWRNYLERSRRCYRRRHHYRAGRDHETNRGWLAAGTESGRGEGPGSTGDGQRGSL